MGGCDPPCTYDDLKKVVGLPGRPVFPGHHGGASGIATQGLKTVSLRRERELRHPEIGPPAPRDSKPEAYTAQATRERPPPAWPAAAAASIPEARAAAEVPS